MAPILSAYLDIIRIAAALVVFADHASNKNITGGLFWQAVGLGQDAVLVFFVLSGFVISNTVRAGHDTLRSFAVKRAARIYSVAIPALILTVCLDAIGQSWNAATPSALANLWNWQVAMVIANGLLFTSEFWSWHFQIGSNGAYWSLGYEVWYYAAFAALAFGARGWGAAVAGLILLAAGPKVALFFTIWLVGLSADRIAARVSLPRLAASALALGSTMLVVGWIAFVHRLDKIYGPFALSRVELLSYGFYLGLAILFAINIIAVSALAPHLPTLSKRASSVVRHIGNQTFCLYLMHHPLLAFVSPLIPWPPESWQTRAAIYVIVPGLIAPVAFLLEGNKRMWRSWADAALAWLGWPREAIRAPADNR